ncbi:MAG: response regulator [Halanaerobiaceae bacterium]
MSKTILVVDDEKNIRELIKYNLESTGYQVILAADGEECLARVGDNVDLIILDLMLPEIDGLAVCRKIRNQSDCSRIPIIMLTAKGEEIDRVVGLEVGADDYMVKPFSPRELIARIKAIFRRVDDGQSSSGEKKTKIKLGDLALNTDSHEVKKGKESLQLTPKEFELLRLLMINRGRVLTRERLLEKIWGYEYTGDTRTVDVHIRRLRKKVGDKMIKTVRGVGYKIAEVE